MKVQQKPAFYLALALITGILSSYLLINNNLIYFFKILLLAELLYLVYYVFFELKKTKKSIYIFLIILFFFLGSFLYGYQDYKYNSIYSSKNFSDSGAVQLLAEIKFDIGDLESNKVYLKAHSISGKKVKYGKIILNSRKLKKYNDGDLIVLELELKKPDPALNPGAFSYADYLKTKGVYLQGWNPQNIKLIQKNKSVKNDIIKVKKIFLNNINYLFTEDKAAFIKAILLGERENLNYDQELLLRSSGASHLLAISGLHMGILIMTFSIVLFRICSEKRTALYLLSFLTFFYIILVGAAVSIIRASLLALLFLWSGEFKREGDFLNIISLTLVINLLLDPLALFTVSLQLSYTLVLALFYLTPLFNNLLPAIFSVSLSAQFASLAISAYYFNEYAFIALITNIWVIPLITIFLPLIFLVILFSVISFNFLKPLVLLIEFGLNFLFKGLEVMTVIQGESLVVGRPKLLIVILYYLLLFSLPYIYQKRYIYLKAKKFKIWQQLIPGIIVLIIISFFVNPLPDNLEINFIAVGQGDGIFIRFPGGKNMLLDTGPPGSDGRNIEYSIISYLNYLGIKDIDYLMISHFDADHAGGIPHLLKRKKVKNLMIPPYHKKSEFHDQLADSICSETEVVFLTAGMNFQISGCQFKILNPQPEKISEDRNENSIVFILEHENKKILFTGDLSQKGEVKIVEKYNPEKIDVLKVGHHGSKSSSGELLLKKIKPELAVISVGRNNFGHPSQEVINRFDRLGIRYLRTDQSGMIRLISDGQKLYLDYFRKNNN
ncbi:MAG: DNA internalization-related competence protein ComEC/Rec2 [Halanaerobium sp.]